MKRVLLIGTVVAALAAMSAEEQSSTSGNIFGALKIESSSVQTMVAVPWCECGSETGDDINVVNMVQTWNLTNGAYIHVYDANGKKFSSWTLEDTEGKKEWQPITTVTSGNSDGQDPQPTVNRGIAFELNRVQADLSKPIYITGQYTNKAVTTTLISSNSGPVYNLIGSPFAKETTLSSLKVENGGANDTIELPIVQDGITLFKEYRHDDGGWYRMTTGKRPGSTTKTYYNDVKIALGVGFWYVCRPDSSAKITWLE